MKEHVKIMNGLTKKGLSIYKISRDTGIAERTLKNLLENTETDPRFSTHEKLIKYHAKIMKEK